MKASFYYDGERDTYILDSGETLKDLGTVDGEAILALLRDGVVYVTINDAHFDSLDDVEDEDEDQFEVSLPDPDNPGHFVTVSPPVTEEKAIEIAKKWGADYSGKINVLNRVPF